MKFKIFLTTNWLISGFFPQTIGKTCNFFFSNKLIKFGIFFLRQIIEICNVFRNRLAKIDKNWDFFPVCNWRHSQFFFFFCIWLTKFPFFPWVTDENCDYFSWPTENMRVLCRTDFQNLWYFLWLIGGIHNFLFFFLVFSMINWRNLRVFFGTDLENSRFFRNRLAKIMII